MHFKYLSLVILRSDSRWL